MGLMDKVKAAAQDITAEAKKATAQGKTKLDQAQIRRKMNDAAEQLGYLIYNERAKGTVAGAEADRLVAEIEGLEAEARSASGSTAPETPSGPVPESSVTPPEEPPAPAN